MSDQGKVQIKVGSPLGSGGVVTNVATNSADIKLMKEMAGNVTGKRIMPTEVNAKRGSFDEAMVVDGGSIILGDGVVSARNLVRSQALIVDKAQVGNAIIDGDRLDLGPNGELSALSANLGTMTTGALQVGSGGVVIGDVTAGISIAANIIKAMKSGVPTVVIDGGTGIITASKFVFTADSSSQVNLTSGTHQFSAGITIGGASDRTLGALIRYFSQANDPGSPAGGSFTLRTGDVWTDTDDNQLYRWNGSSWDSMRDSSITKALGDAADALEAADGQIVGWYQTSAPIIGVGGASFGDIWIDTDYVGFPTDNAIYRCEDSSGGSTGTLGWYQQPNNAVGEVYLDAYNAQITADGKVATFYAATQPWSGMDTGDFWVDTDDGNKTYVYSGAAWVPVETQKAITAIQPGGGVAVSSEKYITTIDMSSGIVIKTSTSTAKTQITSNGIAIYNNSGTLVVQADHSNGLWVNNDTSGSPGVTERVSLAYDGYEVGSIAGGNYTTVQFQQRGNGDTLSINFDLVELCPSVTGAVVRVGSNSELYAKHRTYDGSYKGDATFSFYAASSSGGSPTVKHTVTFKDGLITSWAAS